MPKRAQELCRSPEKREVLSEVIYSFTQEDGIVHGNLGGPPEKPSWKMTVLLGVLGVSFWYSKGFQGFKTNSFLGFQPLVFFGQQPNSCNSRG